MQCLASHIDIYPGKIVEPHPGFQIVYHRHAATTFAPSSLCIRVDTLHHVGTAEISFLHRKTEGLEHPFRNRYIVHITADIFKQAGLEYHVRVHLMHPSDGTFSKAYELRISQFALAAPSVDSTSDELGTDIMDHPDVIFLIRETVPFRSA